MNIFEQAALIKESRVKSPIARRKKADRSGVVIRRAGTVIKNTTKPVVVTAVKPKNRVKVDRSALDASNTEDFEYPAIRRKALGKYVFTEREQLIVVLTKGYSVAVSAVKDLSFTDMLSVFDDVKQAEAKALEFKKNKAIERKERLGRFFESFEIVSDVTSEINSEHYKLEHVEKEEEDVELVSWAENIEQKKERGKEWLLRKAVLLEQRNLNRRRELKDAGHSPEVIECIMTGRTEKVVDVKALDLTTRRKVKYAWFIQHGCDHNSAERKTAQWERYQQENI